MSAALHLSRFSAGCVRDFTHFGNGNEDRDSCPSCWLHCPRQPDVLLKPAEVIPLFSFQSLSFSPYNFLVFNPTLVPLAALVLLAQKSKSTLAKHSPLFLFHKSVLAARL